MLNIRLNEASKLLTRVDFLDMYGPKKSVYNYMLQTVNTVNFDLKYLTIFQISNNSCNTSQLSKYM